MDNIDNSFEYEANTLPQKKKRTRGPIRVSLSVCILCVLLAALFAFMATYVSLSLHCERMVNEAYGRAAQYEKLLEVADFYDEYYLYDIDPETEEYGLASYYGLAVGDRFSSFYTADEWLENYNASIGNATGIGVYVLMDEGGEILVTRVMENSPAERDGLLEGDIILSVDGKKVKEIGYQTAVDMVLGEKGTVVSFEVRRGEEIIEVGVTRGTYDPQTVFAESFMAEDTLYGYIHIIQFERSTPAQFIRAIETLTEMGVAGFVFDVRDNPGGDLGAIVEILDYLLPEGPIVHIVGLEEEDNYTYTSDEYEVDLPMIVLANGNTASAAELFTSALKDYEKAVIVGETTYGKGCGQEGYSLSDGSVVFITTFLYNPPFSENYDGIGIRPDHEVKMNQEWQNTNLFLVPHEEDNQLIKAIEVLHDIAQ